MFHVKHFNKEGVEIMIDRTVKYFTERLEYLKGLIKVCSENKSKCEIEKKELFTQIENYKTMIDEAYDVFSPKSAKNQFIKDQISDFEMKVHSINQNLEELEEDIIVYNNEIENIENILQELKCCFEKKGEQDILEGASESEDKEIVCIDITKETGDIRQENISIKEEILIDKKKVRDIIYKCENCCAFMDMDLNRSKLEIQTIIDILNNLIK